MLKDLVFVSAQPDVPYFHWQTKIYTYNFIQMGIKPEQIHILFAMVNGDTPSQQSLDLKKMGVNVHHFSDTRTDKTYIPSLRPMIMTEWLKKNPEFGKCYFYHDADIVFRKLPDFDNMMNDDICYLSDTLSYIGYNYIMDCCNRYESVHDSLEKGQLLREMSEIIGVSVDIIKENQPNSGGAQYLIKNTDYRFWEKIFDDCVVLYNHMFNFHKKYPIPHEIQMWTSDMWAVLWNLWLINKQTKLSSELSFSWATDSVQIYEKHNILHMAGVTPNLSNTKFYKGQFININPLDKLKENINFFNYVENTSATIKYIEIMKDLIKKSKI